MSDMLIKLYQLPSLEPAIAAVTAQGVVIRRALTVEKPLVLQWVQTHFNDWAAEVEAALCRLPVTCFLAVRDQAILGFACYDVACKNFFGPEAVLESERGRGLGYALLLSALHAQKAQGYAYAIVGGVGPAAFYAKAAGAVAIAGSTPGIYAGRLRPKPRA
jgi:GNAT superfamily N-acetyltransferase